MNLSPRVQSVLVYLFWIVTCLMTVFLLLQLYNALSILLTALGFHRFTQRLIGQFSIMLLGLISLGFIIFAENFYRTAVKRNQLLPRFLRISYIQVAGLALSHLILLIAHLLVGIPLGLTLLILVLEGIGCVLLYWLWHRTLSTK